MSAPEPPAGGSHPGTTYTRFLILIAFMLVSVPCSCSVPRSSSRSSSFRALSVPRSFRSALVFRSAPLGCGYPVCLSLRGRVVRRGFLYMRLFPSAFAFFPSLLTQQLVRLGHLFPALFLYLILQIYCSSTSCPKRSPDRRGLVRGLLPQVPGLVPHT